MKYQKPKVVAKSAPKQTFVAGCSENVAEYRCCMNNVMCFKGRLD